MHRSAGLTNRTREAVKGVADSVPSMNETKRENLQNQTSASKNTTAGAADPLAALGKVMSTGADDDETHPGLEKPLVKQQELKR